MADPQSYYIIFRIINAAITFLVVWNMHQIHKGTPVLKRPLMFNLLLWGVTGWFIYIFLDIFIFSIL